MLMYVQDYDETFFQLPYDAPKETYPGQLPFWSDLLQPYVKSTALFNCPDSGSEAMYQPFEYEIPKYHVAFALSEFVFNEDHAHTSARALASVNAPAEVGLLGDGRWPYTWHNCIKDSSGQFASYWDQSTPYWGYGDLKGDSNDPHHSGGANFAFVDGHSKFGRLSVQKTKPSDSELYVGFYPAVKMTDQTFANANDCDAGSQ